MMYRTSSEPFLYVQFMFCGQGVQFVFIKFTYQKIAEYTYFFYKQLQGQASALKVAYIVKVFEAQGYLIAVQQFHRLTYVCRKCNNFQDSKFIFMGSNFKISPIMLLRQLNFGILVVQQLAYVDYKGKTPLPFNLQLLLLLIVKEA